MPFLDSSLSLTGCTLRKGEKSHLLSPHKSFLSRKDRTRHFYARSCLTESRILFALTQELFTFYK